MDNFNGITPTQFKNEFLKRKLEALGLSDIQVTFIVNLQKENTRLKTDLLKVQRAMVELEGLMTKLIEIT